MERNLTTGSIWKNIFYFSLPYLLSYFLQTLYGMADLFIIGQFEEGMMEYEKVSRQILEGGTYNDPYHVEPIELTKKRQRKIFLVQHLLGWARYLF